MKTIGYLINTFCRKSEGFIYDQVVGIKNFQVEVLTREYINKGQFPYDKVNSINDNFCGLEKFWHIYSYTIFRNCSYFSKIIKQKNIKLLHAHFGPDGVYALKLKQKHSLPLIISFYGHDLTRLPKFVLYPPAWFNYWFYFRELQINGDLFIVNCDFLSRKIIERGFPYQKVKTHYLGININYDSNLEDKEKILLTVARLVEKKGTLYLIKAMTKIVSKDKEIKLYIVGDGILRKSLENLATKLNLKNNVIFLGWLSREEVIKLIKKSIIFVLPSITAKDGDCEGLPTVILEAMAYGLPVVSTYHAGIPEAVINNETGFLVPERDYKELADKLIVLISDRRLREKMGKRAREVVQEKFNIEKQIGKLEKIYKEFI